eukprot:gene6471-13069_t
MTKQKLALILNLPHLQNLIKRDPHAYKEEFEMQRKRFESELEIFKLRPTIDSERFTDLVTFISHVAPCYKDDCKDLPLQLLELMESSANILHPDVRAKLYQALILLRNRGLLDPLILIKLSFRLIAVPDKTLRETLGEYIVNDIKTLNLNKHNDTVNRRIQALLFTIVSEDEPVSALKSVEIISDLYRRRIWTDERTVNVIASACVSPITRVTVAAINFFLGIETKMAADEDVSKADAVSDVNFHEHSKKTKKRARQVKRQTEHNKKIKRDKDEKVATPLFPAIQMLNNPQTLAEKLLAKLRQSGEKFEVKLLILNFVSRLIGCHKLILLSFYSFVQRYLTSHQQSVTCILAYLIQACHELVPPEDLLPVMKVVAHNFITERCSNEVLTVGINSVREIFTRSPALLLEAEMEDFVQDLAMYGRKTHKSVMTAAHSFINTVRELCPSLLRKVDRGKFHDPTAMPSQYGQEEVLDGVEGVELLEAYERGDIKLDSDGDIVWTGDGEQGDSDEEEEGDQWEEMEEEDDEDGEEEDSDDESDGEMDEDDDGWEEVEEDIDEDEGDEEEEEVDHEEEDGEEPPMLVPLPDDIPGSTSSSSAIRLDGRRILTETDFELLAKLRAAYSKKMLDPKFRTKKAFSLVTKSMKGGGGAEDEDEAVTSSFAVEPDSLAPSVKAHKSNKMERITAILSGRTKEKFRHEGHAGGLTHKEKQRTKNYVMVRKGKRSVANKLRTSNSESRYKKMHQKEQHGREKRKRRRI